MKLNILQLMQLILSICAVNNQRCTNSVQFDLNSLSLSSIKGAIEVCKHSCVDVTQFFLDRIQRHDHKINSMISLNPEALKEAKVLDQSLSQTGRTLGPLHCVPVTIKDNIWMTGEILKIP